MKSNKKHPHCKIDYKQKAWSQIYHKNWKRMFNKKFCKKKGYNPSILKTLTSTAIKRGSIKVAD